MLLAALRRRAGARRVHGRRRCGRAHPDDELAHADPDADADPVAAQVGAPAEAATVLPAATAAGRGARGVARGVRDRSGGGRRAGRRRRRAAHRRVGRCGARCPGPAHRPRDRRGAAGGRARPPRRRGGARGRCGHAVAAERRDRRARSPRVRARTPCGRRPGRGSVAPTEVPAGQETGTVRALSGPATAGARRRRSAAGTDDERPDADCERRPTRPRPDRRCAADGVVDPVSLTAPGAAADPTAGGVGGHRRAHRGRRRPAGRARDPAGRRGARARRPRW